MFFLMSRELSEIIGIPEDHVCITSLTPLDSRCKHSNVPRFARRRSARVVFSRERDLTGSAAARSAGNLAEAPGAPVFGL